MSVFTFTAPKIKALECAARDLCGDHLHPATFPLLFIANEQAYAVSYDERRALTVEQCLELAREYQQATPDHWQGMKAAKLLAQLHSLTYNCESNGGALMLAEEGEAYRRRLMQSVAFEVMIQGGPAVHVAALGNIRRVNFDDYQITTKNPRDCTGQVYLIDGKPHPFEGFTTQKPWEAFEKLWQMNDECGAHWLQQYEADMHEQAKRLGLVD